MVITYSFSPTYPVSTGTCSLALTGILSSFIKQVSHPPIKKLIFCLADDIKNPFRNLFNVPSKPLCPPASLWWHKLHISDTIDSGRHIHHSSTFWFLLAALKTSWSNIERATNTSRPYNPDWFFSVLRYFKGDLLEVCIKKWKHILSYRLKFIKTSPPWSI